MNSTWTPKTVFKLVLGGVIPIAALLFGVSFLFSKPKGYQSDTPIDPNTFNVPALVGLDVSGTQRVLGTPLKFKPPTPLAQEWDMDYEKKGVDLTVTYNPHTGKIKEFFLSLEHVVKGNEMSDDDIAKLLAAGSLSTSGSNYFTEAIHAGLEQHLYTGIVVTPR